MPDWKQSFFSLVSPFIFGRSSYFAALVKNHRKHSLSTRSPINQHSRMTVLESAYSRNHQEVVFIKKNIKNNLSLWGFEPAPIFVTKYKNHYTVEANFNLA